jgi:hypothetical protein
MEPIAVSFFLQYYVQYNATICIGPPWVPFQPLYLCKECEWDTIRTTSAGLEQLNVTKSKLLYAYTHFGLPCGEYDSVVAMEIFLRNKPIRSSTRTTPLSEPTPDSEMQSRIGHWKSSNPQPVFPNSDRGTSVRSPSAPEVLSGVELSNTPGTDSRPISAAQAVPSPTNINNRIGEIPRDRVPHETANIPSVQSGVPPPSTSDISNLVLRAPSETNSASLPFLSALCFLWII